MLNYRADGQVVASVLLHTDVFMIVVWVKNAVQPYVLSLYENGESEWRSGQYFADYPKALEAFVDRIPTERQKIGF
jgi:hypothetical protein